ncbi:hypothetical protein [Paenibacillus apiarius]|uniref:Uncharacterized protein n=1 Tax=Paenibacillus apiarius TaxID=46240 RepID=A0ABT4DTF6_9BACL|nr:hypothetical protein [Paenibacillus apiarius]MCY9517406.1 hypothetical protein [Paenibacillus apiarius]MCY9520629.1 hypothetical protein [Paenibacillus apiarius]MCY9552979.1 hypothetical protein [Paenibacillus apiarius]MCY9561654.1 hypothetical protein [Paenibacillus apiarius]MCY9687059.1 hypothetical protein [Paenibacillus apiarius]
MKKESTLKTLLIQPPALSSSKITTNKENTLTKEELIKIAKTMIKNNI